MFFSFFWKLCEFIVNLRYQYSPRSQYLLLPATACFPKWKWKHVTVYLAFDIAHTYQDRFLASFKKPESLNDRLNKINRETIEAYQAELAMTV